MTIDASRAAFIKNEYRWATASDPAVQARDASARREEIPANVDATTASELADLILAQNDTPRVFEVEILDLVLPDDLVGGVPRFVLDAPEFGTDGRVQRTTTFTCDLNSRVTTIKVHG
jgi:hypothetical protein